MREERKKIWVDSFQTKLFIRIGVYWLIYQVALLNFLFVWRLLKEGTGDPLEQYVRFLQEFYPALICFVLVVPILAWDAVRFAHRLIGPIWRFRKTMQEVAAGQPVRPIKLRDGDFLLEMRDDFNGMLDALQRQGVPVLKPADPVQETKHQQPA
jgi:hypothetical protein